LNANPKNIVLLCCLQQRVNFRSIQH